MGADRDLAPGDRVGEYEVLSRIAEGGFGTVFRAVQPLIGKDVAIKVLKRQFSTSPQIVSRFVSEAKAVNKIRHRNIINIFSFGTLQDGRHYYVMDLLPGQPLDRIVEQHGPLPVPQSLEILHEIALALDAAHDAGIVHRDLKPANVFVTDKGEVRLLDFGVAKLLGTPSEHHTGSGVPLGTVSYMSPEQSRGQPIDRRTDVFSLGVMSYQLLTGRLPFTGAPVDVVVQLLGKAPEPPSSVFGELEPELDAPVLAMLEKRAEDRPDRAGQAIAAVEAVARSLGYELGASLSFPPTPEPEDTAVASDEGASEKATQGEVGGRQGSPTTWKVAAGLALAGVAVVGYLWWKPSGGGELPVRDEPAVETTVASAEPAERERADEVTLSFDGEPAGAEILSDGNELLGVLPTTFPVIRGQPIVLTIRKDGYESVTKRIRPMDDLSIPVDLQLRSSPDAGSAVEKHRPRTRGKQTRAGEKPKQRDPDALEAPTWPE